MGCEVVILGAAGYGGGELLRLLLDHPMVDKVHAISRSHGGQPIHAAHPALRGFYSDPFLSEPLWQRGDSRLVVISAQPHGVLATQLPGLERAWQDAGMLDRVLLIDLSGDYRLKDAQAFESAYGGPHPDPDGLDRFVYGCPEASRERLRTATRIANPGCFATALNLALLPLSGLDVPFVAVTAATGSSGSGAKAQAGTHHPERMNDFKAYKALTHQHHAEVIQLLAETGFSQTRLAFVPCSAPLVRGIFATAQFQLPAGISPTELKPRFEAFYEAAPFVEVLDQSPRVAAVAGSNRVELSVHVQDGMVAVLVALDNLMKGMAGQAIQNMNLALGLDERAGLWRPGRWPA